MKYYWNRYRTSIGTQDPTQPPDLNAKVLAVLISPLGLTEKVDDEVGEKIAQALNLQEALNSFIDTLKTPVKV